MTVDATDLADGNVLQSIREHARWQQPCELADGGGIILMAGQTEFPGAYKNCVARSDPRVPAAEVIERARDFFGRRGRSFTVFSRGSRDRDLEDLLKTDGFTQRSDSPCMLVTSPVAMPAVPGELRIVPFSELRHVQDAAAINAEAYEALELPAAETAKYFFNAAQLLSPGVIGCVAYRDEQPLATALAIKSQDAAGVYWVGTANAAQRMGLATLCTAFVTNRAFSDGASVVTLQASPFGAPVYERLGYREYDRLKFYRDLRKPAG
ncbi:GNAT family N-acetyltransferase [Noviherbaspirillum sp.]|uniref:GNAT family N-acetyltransferase n=1 Tax=Noviherbaspirillum sp. TaxID=1926288 RepID=UPI002FE2474E